MSGIPGTDCLRCHRKLPLWRVWFLAFTARGLYLMGTTGVICPRCGERMAIVQGPAVITSIVIPVAAVVLGTWGLVKLSDQIALTEPQRLVWLFTGLAGVVVLHFLILFRLLRLRPLVEGEPVHFPLNPAEDVVSRDA